MNRNRPLRSCRHCGREFEAKSGNQVFCSDACRDASRKASKRRYDLGNRKRKRPGEVKRRVVDSYLPTRQIPRGM